MSIQPEGPYWLDPLNPEAPFPPVELALREPDGLLALGGDLSPQRLLNAYAHSIFPWYSDGQPILWWSPDPRLVLLPENLHIGRSLRKTLRKQPFRLTLDTAFEQVITNCAESRRDQEGTWITDEMQQAYIHLHSLGFAHSVEAWDDQQLVGGLYGVALGRAFFGESMFTRRADASKLAFVHFVHQLSDWGYQLIDCQVYTEHLARFGAREMPRSEFIDRLETAITSHPDHRAFRWQFDPDHSANFVQALTSG